MFGAESVTSEASLSFLKLLVLFCLHSCQESPVGLSWYRQQCDDPPVLADYLVGPVVKASASRADLGFNSHLRHRDFSGLCHTSDLKIDTPLTALPGTWC